MLLFCSTPVKLIHVLMRIISWLGVSCDLFEIIWEVLLLPLNLHLGRYQEATYLSTWAFGCLCDPLHFTELKGLSKFFFLFAQAEFWQSCVLLFPQAHLCWDCHFRLILLLGHRTHKLFSWLCYPIAQLSHAFSQYGVLAALLVSCGSLCSEMTETLS